MLLSVTVFIIINYLYVVFAYRTIVDFIYNLLYFIHIFTVNYIYAHIMYYMHTYANMIDASLDGIFDLVIFHKHTRTFLVISCHDYKAYS